jgi:RNA polymerase sigma-70 factor, ECF subfamily
MEQDLTKALAENLNDSFVEMVRCYQDRLYGFALRLVNNAQDAEEVVQDVFVRVYRALQSYPTDRILELSLKAWLFQITANLSRNKVRGKRLPQVPLVPDNDDQPEIDLPDNNTESPAVSFERKETSRELATLVQALPEKFREAVTLRHVAGLNYNEMSEVLNLPIGTLKSNVHRGVKILKERLEDSGQWPVASD